VKLTLNRGHYVETSASGNYRFRGFPTKDSDRRGIKGRKNRECFFAVSAEGQTTITVIVDETATDED